MTDTLPKVVRQDRGWLHALNRKMGRAFPPTEPTPSALVDFTDHDVLLAKEDVFDDDYRNAINEWFEECETACETFFFMQDCSDYEDKVVFRFDKQTQAAMFKMRFG
jgi:hypothetical protein